MTTSSDFGAPPPGFRLHADTRPGRVRLQVSDLDRSLAYYERVIGLRALDRSDGEATIGVPEDRSPLIELFERPGAAPAPRGGRPGLYHFAILLPDRPDLGAFVRHLGEVGVRAGAADHLVSEAVYLQDPDGLGIEVYADRPRSEWRSRDGQLVMATDPLNLPALVRAAGTDRWTGLPAGTTIGHVHLHVGDLADADAFYHRALGLDRMVWSYPGALFLAAGGYHHHLGLNTWAASSQPRGEDESGLLEWELRVPSPDDVAAALRSLEAAGHGTERGARGGVVRDPWGTALRILPYEEA